MKLLFDQNISHRLIPKINDILPESIQIRQLGLENFSDKQIWEYAKEHEFTIVSFTLTFIISLWFGDTRLKSFGSEQLIKPQII